VPPWSRPQVVDATTDVIDPPWLVSTSGDTADNLRRPPQWRLAQYRDLVRRSPPLLQDILLATALAIVGLLEIWVPFSSVMGDGSRAWSATFVVVACAALAVRRPWPLAAAAVVLLGWPLLNEIATMQILFWGQFVPVLLLVYSVARHAPGRRGVVGAALAAATLLYLDLRVPELQEPGEIVFHWTCAAVAWIVGRTLLVREQRAAASEQRERLAEERAAGVERTSREHALAAVAAERARIARELHDVVAHAVSVMVVQAGAAEQVVDDDPARVRACLAAIRATGSDALTEMRRLVGILRTYDDADDEATASRVPQPGVASLSTLVEQARATGLQVELCVQVEAAQGDAVPGDVPVLPTGLDLAAYRIVQEALTNARRHADARTVHVLVRHETDRLLIEVVDDGRGSTAEVAGNGLAGMRERVAIYGGQLQTSTAPGAGFTVRATLPVATT
jgi:signal transduction histidine kinase